MLYYQAIDRQALDLLNRLLTNPQLKHFALAGGTGLALQIGHRLSYDLDLFNSDDFNPEIILQGLSNQFQVKLIQSEINTLNLVIDDIKVDLLAYKYPLLRSIVQEENLRIYSIEDIAVMKLSALSARGFKKDFYDLYFLFRKYSLNELLSLYQNKFSANQIFHIIKSLIYFDDADNEPDPVILEEITWLQIKNEIDKKVKEYLKTK
jgi:hypothetical protein